MNVNFFENKNILLIGATGGLGIHLATKLCNLKSNLILTGTNDQNLSELQSKIDIRHKLINLNLLNSQSVRDFLIKINKKEEIDIVINCVGINYFSETKKLKHYQVLDIFKINVISIINITSYILRKNILNNNGIFVNIGSVFGEIGYPLFNTYCSTKFALHGFSECLRRELSDSNMKVIYISPRAINTKLNSSEVNNLNSFYKNTVDSPEFVCDFILNIISKNKSVVASIGWKESFLIKINKFNYRITDNFFKKNIKTIKKFLNQHN